MLVKGIIEEQVSQIIDDNHKVLNKYIVRIPVFEAQGSNEKALVECYLMFQPGNLPAYQKGDVVMVDFEQNYINNGIILGQLFTDEAASKINAQSNSSELFVESSATLPKNTTIDDMIVYDEIVNLNNRVNGLTGSNGRDIDILDLR